MKNSFFSLCIFFTAIVSLSVEENVIFSNTSIVKSNLDISTHKEIKVSIERGIQYLIKNQQLNGSWSNSPEISALCITAISQEKYNEHNSDIIEKYIKGSKYLTVYLNNDKNIESITNINQLVAITICLTPLVNYNHGKVIFDIDDMIEVIAKKISNYKKLRNQKSTVWSSGLFKYYWLFKLNYIYQGNFKINEVNHRYKINESFLEIKKQVYQYQNYNLTSKSKNKNFGSFTGDIEHNVIEYKKDSITNLNSGIYTAIGLNTLLYSGLSDDDIRFKAAFKWLVDNVELSTITCSNKAGIYTLTLLLSEILSSIQEKCGILYENTISNWKYQISQKLLSTQMGNGSWTNPDSTWQEQDSMLCTAYAIIALKHCIDF